MNNPSKPSLPIRVPQDIQPLLNEVPFEAKKHLQLGTPEKRWTLADFGYSQERQAGAPFDLAVTTPFQVLTREGVEALKDSIQKLSEKSRASDRIANFIRGSVYYSKFIRDMLNCRDLNNHISALAGSSVLPHPMSLYQGHINLKPKEAGRDVDQWHTDTVSLDFVMLCTDPKNFTGGHFEYFQCPKGQAIRSLIREESNPNVIKVDFPAAGYVILQQGNMVVHRASAVTSGSERTTLVQSFISNDSGFKDVSSLNDCKPVDPPEYLYTEWARYKAFLSSRKLDQLIEKIPYTEDKNLLCMQLRSAIRDVEEAILEISDPSDGKLQYIGNDGLTDLA